MYVPLYSWLSNDVYMSALRMCAPLHEHIFCIVTTTTIVTHFRKCETPDIFDYVAEKREPPPPLQGSAFLKKIIQWSKDRASEIRLHRVPNPS